MKKLLVLLCAVALVFGMIGVTQADLIDFEGFSSFDDPYDFSVVITPTNTVYFSVGSLPGEMNAWTARVGGPVTAFFPNDSPAGTTAGQMFMTDEPGGPTVGLNYYMAFENPVSNLSLDLYDFRADGGAAVGDTATLVVFSDNWLDAVGTDVFTIPTTNLVDGNIVNLAVLNSTAPIHAAAVFFSTPDVGTGIDNVNFNFSVPEPATLLLLGTGLIGLVGFRRKFKK